MDEFNYLFTVLINSDHLQNPPLLFVMGSIQQSDSYQATGCYNLLCSGFIQTNSKIAIGAAISPVSLAAGNQYDITILIWKVN